MPGVPFLTITQVASHFGVPAWKIRRLVDSLDIEIPRAGLYRLEALRAEVRRQLAAESRRDPSAAEQLRKRITVLDRQIDQGAERILSAPASIASTLYAKLEKLQNQRRQLQADPVTSPAECPQENPLANQRAVPFHGETSKGSIYMQRLRELTPTSA